MKKITLEMVRYWLGTDEDEGKRTIREIANSCFGSNPWTPEILYNNIIETWDDREEKII